MCVKSTDKFGNMYWKCNGELHNEHGPAIIKISGEKLYFLNGVQVPKKYAIAKK